MSRRDAIARFRQAAAGKCDTYLIGADGAIDDVLLANAVTAWRINIQKRRPRCISCRGAFASNAVPGAFLLAVPRSTEPLAGDTAALVRGEHLVSVSCFCDVCWSDAGLSDDEVTRIVLRVFDRLIPGARFAR